jgi:hypothetical protein
MVLFLIAGGVLLGGSRHAGVVFVLERALPGRQRGGCDDAEDVGKREIKTDGGGPNEGHEEEREEEKKTCEVRNVAGRATLPSWQTGRYLRIRTSMLTRWERLGAVSAYQHRQLAALAQYLPWEQRGQRSSTPHGPCYG